MLYQIFSFFNISIARGELVQQGYGLNNAEVILKRAACNFCIRPELSRQNCLSGQFWDSDEKS